MAGNDRSTEAHLISKVPELAIREMRQITEAVRYILEARQYVCRVESAVRMRVKMPTVPGDIEDEQLIGLLYQAWDRAGDALTAVDALYTRRA